jgi:integrase/recombinase XerC
MHIRSWIASLGEDHSATSINRKISTLKSFYKYALKSGWIASLPTQKLVSPKKPKRLPSFANESQMNELLEETGFEEGLKGATNRLIIELLYATGMRRIELIQLQDHDVDLRLHQIKVLGKGNKERIVPLIQQVEDLIQDYRAVKQKIGLVGPHLLVLENGEPLYEKYVYNTVKRYLSKVSTQTKKSPHTLRHSFATHLLNHGAELNAVKELLGHASLAATQIYTHNTIDKLKNVYKQAHPKS